MKASFWDRNQYKLAPVFFLLPALILFSIYVIYPIISSLWISLYEWDGIGEKTWIGFKFKLTGNQIDLNYYHGKRDYSETSDTENIQQIQIGVSLADLWFVKRRQK